MNNVVHIDDVIFREFVRINDIGEREGLYTEVCGDKYYATKDELRKLIDFEGFSRGYRDSLLGKSMQLEEIYFDLDELINSDLDSEIVFSMAFGGSMNIRYSSQYAKGYSLGKKRRDY